MNSYANNIFWWLPPILASGSWITSAGEGRVAYIDRLDVARVAATALTTDKALGRVDIGGAEALSASDIVFIVKDVFDVSTALEQVSDEQREASIVAAGLPVQIAKHLTSVDATARNGGFDSVNDLVERLTGTPPRSFRDFLLGNRKALLAAAKPQK